jgi:hypothetical protein
MKSELRPGAINVNQIELAIAVDVCGSHFRNVCTGRDDWGIFETDRLCRNRDYRYQYERSQNP